MSRVVYHRYMFFGKKILTNYVEQFSVNFLFLEGDENIRHQTKEFGILYHWEIFSLIIGLVVLLRKRSMSYVLPVVWILIAAIPAALTTLSPHTLRFLPASPAFALLSAVGVYTVWTLKLHKKIVLVKRFVPAILHVAIVLVIFLEAGAYLHFYFSHYARISARDWQYGYEQLVQSIEEHKRPGQKIYITREQGRPSIYLFFFTRMDPREIQKQDETLKKDQQEILEIGAYTFTDVIPQELHVLVASSPDRMPEGAVVREVITLPDGEVIWHVWERIQ